MLAYPECLHRIFTARFTMPQQGLLSPLVAGLWRLDRWGLQPAELARWIHGVVDLGVTTLDLAEVYGRYTCHQRVGEALRADPSWRERVQIVTKFGIEVPGEARPGVEVHHYDTSGEHMRTAVERALEELGTDHIDCLLIHRWDPLLDVDAFAAACARERAAGRVLRFGVSNFLPHTVRALAERIPGGLATNQVEQHPLHLDTFLDGTTDLAQELSLPLMAWSPLAGGRLLHAEGEREEHVRSAMRIVGERHGLSLDQVAFAWLARHPARIHPITGTGQLERIAAAQAALEVQLDREDWFRIWTASQGEPLP